MYKEYYKDDETVMQIVRLGRDLITKCEENGIFFENTEEDYVLVYYVYNEKSRGNKYERIKPNREGRSPM